jgi:hypothetical protein
VVAAAEDEWKGFGGEGAHFFLSRSGMSLFSAFSTMTCAHAGEEPGRVEWS